MFLQGVCICMCILLFSSRQSSWQVVIKEDKRSRSQLPDKPWVSGNLVTEWGVNHVQSGGQRSEARFWVD